MGQSKKVETKYFLKKVIRRVAQKSKTKREDCVSTRYPLNPGILGLIGKKEIKYFEVYNNHDNRNYAENIQNIEIDDFDSSMKIIIIMKYRISCNIGEENKLTEFLGKGDTAERTLIDFIDKFSHKFYQEHMSNFILKLDENIKKMSHALEKELNQKAGLSIAVKASLKNEDKVQDISLSDSVKVVPKDMERFIMLNLNYILKASDKNLAALYMNNTSENDEIRLKINTKFSAYISERVNAHELFYKFMNKEKALSEVITEINEILKPYGRKIQFQKMYAEHVYMKKLAEIEVEDRRVPVDRSKENTILIKNKLQFELNDAGKYIEARMPKLSDWAKEEISNLYKLKVFDWEYIDFLVNFERLKIEIETEMREKASKIGYTINQIISEPKLEENVFLRMDTHMFEYKKLATADAGITADFNLTVTFMLNDKQAFRELLKYDDNAKESLRKMFEVELKKVLSYETPERIFLQYYNDNFQGETESLKLSLEGKIKKHIEEKLNATVQDIHVVPVDNGILEPLYRVRGQSKYIEFDLAPKIEGDPIRYRATLVVHGQDNNNWSQLVEGKYDMEKVTQLVIRTLQAEFNMLTDKELRFRSLEHRRFIEKIANDLAKDIVSKRFGLIVEIENLDRNKNSEEILAFESKKKELEYVYKERDSNLQFLSERNSQDREQMLHLSTTMDEEDQEEMDAYAKRVGISEIEVSSSKEKDTESLNGLLKLAEETQSLNHLENIDPNLISPQLKQIEIDSDQKDK